MCGDDARPVAGDPEAEEGLVRCRGEGMGILAVDDEEEEEGGKEEDNPDSCNISLFLYPGTK